MHELSLAQSLMDVVAESAAREGIARVRSVRAVVGAWSAIIPETLQGCFAMLAAESGPLFAGACLEVEMRPALGECVACGSTFAADEAGLCCPGCGAVARLVSGTELAVDSYEGD